MKRLLVFGGIAVLMAALALPAFARGPGWGGGPGGDWGPGPGYGPNYGGWDKLTDQQRNQLTELSKKFYDSTAQLRNQIWTKRGELQTMMSSPNPDADKARALRKDLSDLQAKMAQERLNFGLEVRKINPDARFGMGYGHGGWGRGMGRGGYGPGCGSGGYGPGGGGGAGYGGYGPMMGRHMGRGFGQGPCWNQN